ncbi:hypothetical protein Leryth_022011 [Lithospermum erythrorhizon]|nr:hypothetical protein Leryth_022011 [Lithospermum erythrorhizon]
MFKSWKAEKKIKAIFEMQFQATQVPLLKAKNLMVSLVPADAGKPSVRVGKAKIVEGSCIWENPIYETVKLVREAKTGRFKEKVYYLVVSTGSSRKSFLGEACVDFADLIETPGVIMLSLPLQPTDSGAILHVTCNRMQPAQDSSNDIHEYPMDESNGGCLESEDQGGRSGLSSNEDGRCSGTTDNSSLSLNYIHQNVGVDSAKPNSFKPSRTFTDWSSESASEGVMEIAKGSEDNLRKETVNETSQNTIERLENNIQALERQAEFSELEIQSLRKRIAKESRREQELSKQISSLKDERDSFKTKYEQIKSLPNVFEAEKTSIDPQAVNVDARENQNRKLRLKLQKAEDSNSELILAIRDLNKKLNQKNTEMSQLSSKLKEMQETTSELRRESKENSDPFKGVNDMQKVSGGHKNADEAVELKQIIEELYSEIEEYKNENEELRTKVESISQKYEILKNENKNLQSDLDKTHIEMVDIQREHTESLSTARWLRLQTERLEKQMKKQELKYSESLEAINELETEITRLEKELEQQEQEYQEHLEVVTQVNSEHESRARAAEDALQTVKYDAAQSVDRLHEELRKVSIDVSSKIDEHEKISTGALAEAHDLRLQNQALEELVEKTKGELSLMKELHERKLQEIPNRFNLDIQQVEDIQVEHIKQTKQIRNSVGSRSNHIMWIQEKEELETELASLKNEAKILREQSVTIKALLNEMKNTEANLYLEVEKYRVKYDELERNFLNQKSEKEELQMINFQTNQSNETKVSNLFKALTTNANSCKGGDIKGSMHPRDTSIGNGVPTQRCDEIGWEKEHTSNSHINCELLSEISELKERNKHMEVELKEMQDRYSDISLKFAEVEGERQQLVMTLRNLKNGKSN